MGPKELPAITRIRRPNTSFQRKGAINMRSFDVRKIYNRGFKELLPEYAGIERTPKHIREFA